MLIIPHAIRIADLASIQTLSQQCWITKPLPLSMHTNHISNSAILNNNYMLLLSALCACVQMYRMESQMKFVSDRFEVPRKLWKSNGLVDCSMTKMNSEELISSDQHIFSDTKVVWQQFRPLNPCKLKNWSRTLERSSNQGQISPTKTLNWSQSQMLLQPICKSDYHIYSN